MLSQERMFQAEGAVNARPGLCEEERGSPVPRVQRGEEGAVSQAGGDKGTRLVEPGGHDLT